MKYDLVLVEWMDSFGVGSQWEPIGDDPQVGPFTAFSAGFLVKQTEDALLIVPHWHDGDDERGPQESGCGDMIIPAKAVVKLTKLYPG